MMQQLSNARDSPQVAAATGQTLLHRFYYRHSMAEYPVKNVAMASVFLASKLEEKQKKVKDIVNVFLRLDQQQSGRVGPVDGLNSLWYETKNALMQTELAMLRELGFSVYVEHPHKFLLNYLNVLGLAEDEVFTQMAWNYANDSLRTSMCVRYKPEVIASACIYMASRILQHPLPESPPWWELFDATKAQLDEIAWHIIRIYQALAIAATPAVSTPTESPASASNMDRSRSPVRAAARSRSPQAKSRSRSPSRSPRRRSRSRSPRRYESKSRSTSRDRYRNYSNSRRIDRDHNRDSYRNQPYDRRDDRRRNYDR